MCWYGLLLLFRDGLTGYFSSSGGISYCVDDVMVVILVFFGLSENLQCDSIIFLHSS